MGFHQGIIMIVNECILKKQNIEADARQIQKKEVQREEQCYIFPYTLCYDDEYYANLSDQQRALKALYLSCDALKGTRAGFE